MAWLMEENANVTIEMELPDKEKDATWPKILRYNYEKYGADRRAMRHKHFGIWHPYTWEDYYLNVKHLALGLLGFGFKPGDKVLIIGDNSPQWYYAVLAAQANRGVSVGLFSDLLPSEIKYFAENSEARFAVVEGQEQVDKFLQIRGELPQLKKIIYWNYKGLAQYDEDILAGYREALQRGQAYETEHPGCFEQNVAAGQADDVCAIIYTSGTVGAVPKGATHTHRTLRASADHLLQLDPWHQNDNVVPYLPPVWFNEYCLGIGCHLLAANILNFAEAPETQQRDSRETGPSIVFYGARLWESQASLAQDRIRSADAVKRSAFRLLMPLGKRLAETTYRRQSPRLLLKVLYFLANAFLFKPIKHSLGLLNARICYSTGAILSPDAFGFYHALNLPLKNLYGSAEGGIFTGSRNDNIHFETVGPAQAGSEVKISEEGELIYRQPGIFCGYYKDPERTEGVLKDGWFQSGDSGFIREDGQIVLVDRAPDLVVLENGETLAPQNVESRLRFSPHIKDAWIVAGPKGAFAAAIIIISYDDVGRWAGERKIAFTNLAELSQAPEVYELVRQDIERVNRTLPVGSAVQKFVNLHKEFDPDEGELTRNRKLRRAILAERYRELVDAIYDGNTVVPLEAQISYRDGRMGTVKTNIHIASVEGAG